MTGAKNVSILVGAGPAAVAGEALRGALGLTLRGDRITVVLDPAATAGDREAERARQTLAAFGHTVAGPEAFAAALAGDVIEQWGTWTAGPPTLPARPRALLHLVRPARQAQGVAPGERVVDLDDRLDDEQLLDHVLASAGPIVVW